MKTKQPDFIGYNHFVLATNEHLPGVLPKRIKLTDSGKLVDVNLDAMPLVGDQRGTLRLSYCSQNLSPSTAEIFFHVTLHALSGRRKVSTVLRWTSEFRQFTRIISGIVGEPLTTITFEMFNWYTSKKEPSQVKMLRSFLKYWFELGLPGISSDLKGFIETSKPPKPRGTIEIQNSVERERPFSISETKIIISDIDKVYINGAFNPQDYLMWRLIVSEAMRPSQMRLLIVGDVDVKLTTKGTLKHVSLMVPIVKQAATPARSHMVPYIMSEPVSRAIVAQLDFIHSVLGETPAPDLPLFCIKRKGSSSSVSVSPTGINISNRIVRTRTLIASLSLQFESLDFFTRRFKHTKLTHLAMLGAPLDVLARAGYHTSSVSLHHYVDLTDEAFEKLEDQLSSHHDKLVAAFQGRIVDKKDSTNPDPEHTILESSLEHDLGSCGSSPCDVLTPFGCYVCPRFEAFIDAPHELVLNALTNKKNRAIQMGLPRESINRDDHLISAVVNVIDSIAMSSNES